MYIDVRYPIKPCSHQMGEKCLIPQTTWVAQIFPTKLCLFNQKFTDSQEKIEFIWELEGPFFAFTVLQDLERKELRVFANTPRGWLKYTLYAHEQGFCIFFKKIPQKKCVYKYLTNMRIFLHNRPQNIITEKNSLDIPMKLECALKRPLEKLFLGVNKSLDIFGIKKRMDLKEIFPLWFYLGQQIPQVSQNIGGTAQFLNIIEKEIEIKNRQELEDNFLRLFLTSFSHLLVPRLHDQEFQGIFPDRLQETEMQKHTVSPLVIVQKGAALIRSLFFQQKKNQLMILPLLFSQFVSGRLKNVQCEDLGILDFQWSKGILLKMVFYPEKNSTLYLQIPQVKNFRLKKKKKERGVILSTQEPIAVEKELVYFFDRFQK